MHACVLLREGATEKSGRITAESIRSALGQDMEEAELRAMVKVADSKGDGSISKRYLLILCFCLYLCLCLCLLGEGKGVDLTLILICAPWPPVLLPSASTFLCVTNTFYKILMVLFRVIFDTCLSSPT